MADERFFTVLEFAFVVLRGCDCCGRRPVERDFAAAAEETAKYELLLAFVREAVFGSTTSLANITH